MITPFTNHPTPEKTDESWWKLDSSMWLLLGGLLLLSATFVNSQFLDFIFVSIARVVDFRLWPWWYFAVLIVIVGFSVKWFLIFRAWNEGDLDELDAEAAKRFVFMSVVITAEMLILVFLHVTTLLKVFTVPVWLWFRFGTYSHIAALTFLVIVVAMVITVYYVKEWLIFTLRPD